ncbi:septation protein A [Zavarzinia sp. CC-PAN008]|uniref:septation protein A n=1 Tax=Zavarzinia sp. CC-PAN008 TaxID=3243332 RepID=UPI003F748BD3
MTQDAPPAPPPAHAPMSPWLRLATEAGPLIVFFVCNAQFGLIVGTGAFMAATLASLAVTYHQERRIPVLPLVSGVCVLAFGGLTVALDDELFIKIKPTVVNLLFATALFAGLAFRQFFLKMLLGSMIALDDAGWRILTVRWGVFFLILAALNEIVWRSFSTETWISFKLLGIMPLTLVFSALQLPLLQRHSLSDASEKV